MIKLLVSMALSVMVAGSGIGLIAQQAKPGDMLYGFKTTINEKIAGMFVTEYTAQVDFEVSLLQERLEEIDQLVREGRLNNEDAVFAKTQLVAQLEKTQTAIANASNQKLTAEQKARIAASLSRLQTTLATYRSSLTVLDTSADAAVAAKPQLKKGGNGKSKSLAVVIAEVADTIGQTAEEVLDTVVDIAEDYSADESATSTEEEVVIEETATSTDDILEEDGVEEESATTTDEQIINEVEVEAETDTQLEVDTSEE